MAAHQLPAGALHDCVNRLRSELDEDVMASTVQSGISLDRRGYVRPAAEDRPGLRSPFSEGVCTPPEDMAAASDDSSPALRESELGYPTQNAPCVSCELLRTEIAALRNELHLARSAEDPVLTVRCLRYHEQRLDALVNLFSEMEQQLRGLAQRAVPSAGSG
eukprot:s7068_g2.t1